nr:MAG: hypothetical protein [Microvirus sp.]
MGRSKGKKRRKAARSDFSNHRLPTFDRFDRSLRRMVGLSDSSRNWPTFKPNFDLDLSLAVDPTGFPLPTVYETPSLPAATPQIQRPLPPVQPETKNPLKDDVCVKRHTRTEVLHALNKTGKGGGQKTPRWTEKSKIKC